MLSEEVKSEEKWEIENPKEIRHYKMSEGMSYWETKPIVLEQEKIDEEPLV